MKAEEYRMRLIEELENSSITKNLVIEETEKHVFIVYDKVIGKLSALSDTYKPCLLVFDKRKKKPVSNYYYMSEKQRNDALIKIKQDIQKEEENKAAFIEKCKAESDKIQSGTIMYCSWGYEQTNIDFYIILERKGQVLTIQRIGKIITKENRNDSGECIANPDCKIEEPFKKRLSKYGSIKMTSYSSLSVWDNRPLYWSNYY